jgi:hypothetical protein
MPAMPAKPVTTPIPVQLPASEFHQFILPHLTIPKRGPKRRRRDVLESLQVGPVAKLATS